MLREYYFEETYMQNAFEEEHKFCNSFSQAL